MVSARPQFEAACQLHEFAAVADIQRHLPCKQVDAGGNPASSSNFRWRDWPNGLGTGLWLQSREFDSLISPQLGGSYKGITHGLQP